MSFDPAGITSCSKITNGGPYCWHYTTTDPIAEVVDNYFSGGGGFPFFREDGDLMAITASDGKKLVAMHGGHLMTKIANGVTSFFG